MGAAFGALMLSFLIALFLFSDASSRKRPVFFLSAAAVTLGAVEGFMITHFHASFNFVLDLKVTNAYTALINFVLLFAPIPVQMILLLRIVSAYQDRWLILVLLLPVLIFIARIFNMLVAIIQIATRPWNFVADWNHLPFSKIEWILQLIFNVSVAFLRQLDLPPENEEPQSSGSYTPLVWKTLRMIWMTSLTNFIIPCILQIVQIALILHGRQGKTEDQWFSECSLMMVLNGYLTIIGVVFATVWANWTIQSQAEVWSRLPTTPSSAALPWSQDFHASEH
ncbi:hypothetical protein R3P38DRAFT_3376254 [Favolaschia claudopus]|uniref:CFEM domain-containing protein n=1 Tax=Favolaschia claudopus TaxID=2862362 RepID=A0AAV9YZ71_9AGAR